MSVGGVAQSLVAKYAERIRRENVLVHSYGVELEGGIPDPSIDELERWCRERGVASRFEVGSDGSVHVGRPWWYSGGYWVDDVEIRFWSEVDRIELLLEFIALAYKLGLTQNETCGNHVHVRLRDDHVMSLLFSESFVKYFQRAYALYAKRRREKYGDKYLARMENSYCSFYRRPEFPEALWAYQQTRYRAVNFQAIDKHGTIEFRIFPHCKGAEEYFENIAWLNRVINRYVDRRLKRGVVVYVAVRLPKIEEEVVEEVEV